MQMIYDLVSKRYLFFAISLAIILPGLISLVLPGGLRPGIDFSSGSIMTVRFDQPVEQGALRDDFAALGHPEAIVQRSDENTYIIRTLPLAGAEQQGAEGQDASQSAITASSSERQKVEDGMRSRFGSLTVLSFDQVSPIVAQEIVNNSVLAVLAACVGILIYLSWAFRHVRSAWRYGICAVVALLHDTLVVLGVFSILGRIFGIELDALFITAILTVIGFSVHDTIVVFDRIRENSVRHVGEPFEDIVNHSLMQTMGRSLTTSLTVLLTLFTLWLFGGVTIRNFVLALLVGILSGTYSSIFNASMLLVVWENGELGRLFGRGRSQPQPALGRA
ncbi:MAG: preprotein translocase subunit SecF [Chloroflexota bacterium]|jgi:preprotein translocase subunit SecF|nr:preprotein translocase subunit SecF [Chloroflexota bacterium]